MTSVFFILSLVSAALTYNVHRPIARPPAARVIGFFAGWLWGEAAPWVIGAHVVAVLGFALGGAISGGLGLLGLITMAVSAAVLTNTYLDSGRAAIIFDRALKDGLGERFEEEIRSEARSKFESGIRWEPIALPFRTKHPDVECIKDIQFGREKGVDLKLDILRHRSAPRSAPVLLQIHGGGWVVGYKENQALPLMNRLASLGWVCVNVDYRLSPHATFPEHLIDCKSAIAWIKDNIDRYGGNPDFIVATGGSAGGHLASLVGLTGNAPEYQPGFEKVDTRVQGCVPIYGIFDLANRHGFHDATQLPEFIAEKVMKGSYDEIPEVYHASSPLDRVHEDAPAFFIIHGDTDTLAPVDDARVFTESLRRKSKQPVLYAELPGAQHAFEVFHSLRSQAAVDAVERFAEHVYSAYLATGVTKGTAKRAAKDATKAAPKKKAAAKKAGKKAETKPKSAAKLGGAKKAKPSAKAKKSAAKTNDADSRVVHLPASKSESGKSKPQAAKAGRVKAKTATTKRKAPAKAAPKAAAKRASKPKKS